MPGGLLSPAGGLVYHGRAWRYRQTLWQAFLRPLAGWLGSWAPTEPALLLVGPSAGYCLPAAVLERFERITGIEPDPLARWLFARRLPTIARRTTWVPVDPFLSADALADLGRRTPHHAVLFANVLGQLATLYPDARWIAGLPALLARRSWASFHDRLSCSLALSSPAVSEPVAADARDVDLLARFHPGPLPSTVEIVDHGTQTLFPPDVLRRYLAWQLTPRSHHLIELVRRPD